MSMSWKAASPLTLCPGAFLASGLLLDEFDDHAGDVFAGGRFDAFETG